MNIKSLQIYLVEALKLQNGHMYVFTFELNQVETKIDVAQ